MIRVGIIGASGYGGGELVRLLSQHPEVELTYLSSQTYAGLEIGDALPNMKGFSRAKCEAYDPAKAIERCDVLFFAQHNGWAMKAAGQFLNAGLKIIDLSADFRLRDVREYEEWYKLAHTSPELIEEAVFGLPEIYGDQIANARLIANPGCYVTGAILSLAPLLKGSVVDPETIIIDSKSGLSGVGRSKFTIDNHFPEVNQGIEAYGIGGHRHVPEMEQELSLLAGTRITVNFTPHRIPVTRGILTTVYASIIGDGWSTDEFLQAYKEFYANSPFIVVLEPGEFPNTKDVLGSNYFHVGLQIDPRTNRVVVVSALDNLMKGMASQAIQNMNLMFDLDQTTGIEAPGVFPW